MAGCFVGHRRRRLRLALELSSERLGSRMAAATNNSHQSKETSSLLVIIFNLSQNIRSDCLTGLLASGSKKRPANHEPVVLRKDGHDKLALVVIKVAFYLLNKT